VTVCETVKTQLASHSSSGWAFLISTIWHWVKSRHLFYLFIYFFIIIIILTKTHMLWPVCIFLNFYKKFNLKLIINI